MGLFSQFKRKAIGAVAAGAVKANRTNARGIAASAWAIADGWKTWIVAVIAVYKLACHDCATAGYLLAVERALGWDSIEGAFNAEEALTALLVMLALGHKLVKAAKEYRAGISAKDLGRSPLDQRVALVTPKTEVVVNATAQSVVVAPDNVQVGNRTAVPLLAPVPGVSGDSA